jgi:hypothetical protein
MFSREAVTSLFLSEYVPKRKPLVLGFVECEDCGSRFFSHRYSDSECQTLFKLQRGAIFQGAILQSLGIRGQ